jgi:hypothetical protein
LSDKVVDEVYREHGAFFKQFALNEIMIWLDFLNFWISQHEHAPILLMRYEDLIQNPQTELLRVLEFATCEGSNDWAGRVDEVLQQEGHGYQSTPLGSISRAVEVSPQPTQKVVPFGKSLKRFSLDLLHQMHDLDKFGWLETLGYHVFKGCFPQNIANGDFPPLPADFGWNRDRDGVNAPNSTNQCFQVNQATELELRPPHCPFGRSMRTWRRKQTRDDTQPFPTRSITK